LNETVRCRPEGCRDNARNRAANMEAVLRRAHCNIPFTEDEGKTELAALRELGGLGAARLIARDWCGIRKSQNHETS